MIIQLLILAVLLAIAFYAGRFIFWLLFLKDAPTYDDQENFYFGYHENK